MPLHDAYPHSLPKKQMRYINTTNVWYNIQNTKISFKYKRTQFLKSLFILNDKIYQEISLSFEYWSDSERVVAINWSRYLIYTSSYFLGMITSTKPFQI